MHTRKLASLAGVFAATSLMMALCIVEISGPGREMALVQQSTAVSSGALDEGLPTLTDQSIWDKGSPQNEGWSGGDYETGTGSIKGTQYSWWQRHLKPQKQFESEIAALQKSEPHYDEHGNEVSPVKGVDIGEGNPMSFRGPGFYRMSP